MFYQLPPVGNRVWMCAGSAAKPALPSLVFPYSIRFFNSGTAALAAAIVGAIKRRQVANPEVLLPAYGCPDLVSAVTYAGVKPVLVDLERDRPWIDLKQASDRINSNTVALVAASLCGIAERLTALREITDASGVLLIEDSAQLFPGCASDADWVGDYVVLSFGRGKPVSLLGGGAVLSKSDDLAGLLPNLSAKAVTFIGRLFYRARVGLYNTLISPRCYWALKYLPFLHLGETRYTPLAAIEPIDAGRLACLDENIIRYQALPAGHQQGVAELIASLADEQIIDLPVSCQPANQGRLLRYPLLIEPSLRERVFTSLEAAGMGVSRMYPDILPAIEGMSALLAGQGRFPEAERFSRRLLTLPLHTGVSTADLQTILAAINDVRK